MIRLLIPAILLAAGCATHADRAKTVRSAFYIGDTDRALALIDAAAKKSPRDADVLKLDKGMVLLAQGKPKEAEQLFREVRDSFEAKEGIDAGEEMKAMLLDDQQRAYAGEDYEKVMVRVMLALCNLLQGGGDAEAYALQVNQKQQQIIQNSKCKTAEGQNLKANYKMVPVGAYLHAAMREATHVNYDDAERSLQLVANWQPDFEPVKADLARVKSGHHSQPGHGVVYVFALIGEGPMKVEKAEPVSQISLLIADRLVTALGKHSLPPTLAPIKVPVAQKMASFGWSPGTLNVRAGGVVGQSSRITDIGTMAEEQSQAVLADAVARAVVRRVVKKAAIYGAKEAIGTNKNAWASLALDVAGVAWEATESADTRCWSLLPDQIQVLRLELPAGEHELSLQPIYGSMKAPPTTYGPVTAKVKVENGRNTYVLSNFACGQLIGTISTSR